MPLTAQWLTEHDALWGVAIVAAIFAFSVAVSLLKCFQRCPSNRVLVKWGVGGGKQSAQCIQGGATFVIPVFQDYDFLSLEPIQIEIPLKGALSAENIRVNVPSVFTVAIGTEPEVMQNAAIRLLGLSKQQIGEQASDIIFGQLRQVIASMQIEEINRDREKFLDSVQHSLEPELNKIGLVLINVNITDITDDSGYIEAIGRKAASAAIQQAEIDVAEQTKRGSIGVARAQQEREVQVADAAKVMEIGTKAAERDKVVQVAELQREQAVGVERAKFNQEVAIKQAERDKRVQTSEAEAAAISGENSAQATIAASNAELAVKRAEAYQIGESRKRQAEAAVLEAQFNAQAKAALAEAAKVEAEQRAALEAPAKAQKARTVVEAEAEAARRRIEAEGEAQAIFARLEAEARGEYERLSKKAQGLGEIVKACGGSQEAFQLLMLEHMKDLSETAAKAISNIKFDKVIVWENGGANGSGSVAGFLQNMAKTLPPMMQIMQEIGGVQMPEYFGKMAGSPQPPGAPSPSNGHAEAKPGLEVHAAGADRPSEERPHKARK
jgi:flotillin